MSSHDSASPQPSTATEPDLRNYQALSALALGALVIGIVSPVAWITPVLWIVPGLGVLLALIAMRAIARNADQLTGRKLAVGGLVLSLLFGSAAISQSLSRTWWLRGEAQQVVQIWFELLSKDEPAQAHRWMTTPQKRHADDDSLWSYYRNTADARAALESFVQEPATRFLLAHGSESKFRYWMSEGLGPAHDGADMVRLYYAVTRKTGGVDETFFLRFALRRDLGNPQLEAWTISEVRGRVNPFEEEL